MSRCKNCIPAIRGGQGMLVARLEVLTQSLDLSAGPVGVSATNAVNTWNGWHDQKGTSAHAESVCRYSEVP